MMMDGSSGCRSHALLREFALETNALYRSAIDPQNVPRAGIEPATFRLLDECTTICATGARVEVKKDTRKKEIERRRRLVLIQLTPDQQSSARTNEHQRR